MAEPAAEPVTAAVTNLIQWCHPRVEPQAVMTSRATLQFIQLKFQVGGISLLSYGLVPSSAPRGAMIREP